MQHVRGKILKLAPILATIATLRMYCVGKALSWRCKRTAEILFRQYPQLSVQHVTRLACTSLFYGRNDAPLMMLEMKLIAAAAVVVVAAVVMASE